MVNAIPAILNQEIRVGVARFLCDGLNDLEINTAKLKAVQLMVILAGLSHVVAAVILALIIELFQIPVDNLALVNFKILLPVFQNRLRVADADADLKHQINFQFLHWLAPFLFLRMDDDLPHVGVVHGTVKGLKITFQRIRRHNQRLSVYLLLLQRIQAVAETEH